MTEETAERTTQMAHPGEVHAAATLFDQSTTGDLKKRWSTIQAEFVDEPRAAVKEADELVGEVVERLTSGFTHEREALEQEWSKGKDVSTEELRQAIRRYRSFFDRLLSI